ncbi:M28 family peptidase, partial [bacterium]|nr:M28 family peptidase [bacterium]
AWEAVRLLRELGLVPRRTLRLVLFADEEQTQAGAKAYAAAHAEELACHRAALECDSGGFRPVGFRVEADSLTVLRLRDLAAPLLALLDAADIGPGGSGVDVSTLVEQGVVGIGHRVDSARYFDYHHSPADTFDKIDGKALAQNVAAVAIMAYALAEEPGPPCAGAAAAGYGQPKGACARAQAMIAATSGAKAIQAGATALRAGGSSADAAVTIALAQTVLCAGAWDSFAGMLYALHYEAATGEVVALNAGFDIPRAETDPLSIPRAPTPSGRTALVGGFTAGLDSLHGRFGRLPWSTLVQPAIALADTGFVVDAFLARILKAREALLSRTEAARAIFLREGRLPVAGDRLQQTTLAATLRALAELRSAPFYTGEWAARCVDAVRAEGGRLTAEDLAGYRARFEPPLRMAYHGFALSTLGGSELGGVQLVEGLNLLALAGLPRDPHYSRDAAALHRFIQVCRAGYVLTYSPVYQPDPGRPQPIPWIAPGARIEPAHAAALWQRLQSPGWEAKLAAELSPPPAPASGGHSDCIVVVDAAGDITVLVHSINTSLWGATGIFVDGVSIPDPASFQQDMMARAGAGQRLPNVVNPVIALRDGQPVLAAGAIGNALHECMLQAVVDILDCGLTPRQSMAMPRFWGPWWGGEASEYARQAIEADAFAPDVVAGVEALGQPLRAMTAAERRSRVSYWAAIQLDPATGLRCAAAPPEFDGLVEVLGR